MTDVKQFLQALRTADAHNLGLELGNEEVSELRLILSGIASLELQLSEARARLAWIPVGERLPEEFTPVLAFSKDNDKPVTAILAAGFWWSNVDDAGFWSSNVDWALNVTHWMPLPELPEVKE